jgi:hypothetical protein
MGVVSLVEAAIRANYRESLYIEVKLEKLLLRRFSDQQLFGHAERRVILYV